MFAPACCPLCCAPTALSNEAATQITQWLIDFALWFESAHLAQIRRHHQAMHPMPERDTPCNVNQIEPFEPLEPF